MDSSNNFITTRNIIGIAETLLSLELNAFELKWHLLASDLHQHLSKCLQRYNEILHSQPASILTLLTPKQLLHQEVELLIQYARTLWLVLSADAKDCLWAEWLKLRLVKPAKLPALSTNQALIPLAEAVNA